MIEGEHLSTHDGTHVEVEAIADELLATGLPRFRHRELATA